MAHAVLLAPLLIALLVSGAPVARAAQADATAHCLPQTATGKLTAASRPVIFVHGWTGGAMTSMASTVRDDLGGSSSRFITYAFDYSTHSTEWAAEPDVAVCLGRFITQIARASTVAHGDGKILLVAHSMGGLAARFAVDKSYDPAYADTARAAVAGLITIDTPSTGSPWGNTPFAILKEVTSSFRVPPFTPGQDAGRCLAAHDPNQPLPSGCASPPYLPVSVPVDQIDGQVTISRTIFGFHAYDIPLGGDSIVPVASEQGYWHSGPTARAPQGEVINVGPTFRCTGSSDLLLQTAAHGVLTGGSALARVQSVARSLSLFDDSNMLNAMLAGRATSDQLEFLGVAAFFTTCAHSTITGNPDVARAVATDLTVMDQTIVRHEETATACDADSFKIGEAAVAIEWYACSGTYAIAGGHAFGEFGVGLFRLQDGHWAELPDFGDGSCLAASSTQKCPFYVAGPIPGSAIADLARHAGLRVDSAGDVEEP